MDKYKISQMAKLTGLTTKTIRFYEEAQVVNPARRSENGYRYYPPEAVEELKLLKYARELGLPLAEIKKLLKGCGDGNCQHSQEYVASSIDNYLIVLNKKIAQMKTLGERLRELKNQLISGKNCRANGKYCCDILHQLLVSKNGGETK